MIDLTHKKRIKIGDERFETYVSAYVSASPLMI